MKKKTISLSDLKVGDKVHVDTLIDQVQIPFYGLDDECGYITLKNVPVAAMLHYGIVEEDE